MGKHLCGINIVDGIETVIEAKTEDDYVFTLIDRKDNKRCPTSPCVLELSQSSVCRCHSEGQIYSNFQVFRL